MDDKHEQNSISDFKNQRKKCVFCCICDGEKKSEIVYQDEEYIAFPDIKPATKHHYLVITRSHIPNAKILTKDQVSIVDNLVRIGKQILEDVGADITNARFGFHWPPFNSIAHLHLHVIYPIQEMGFISRAIFAPDTWWFVTAESVLSKLRNSTSHKGITQENDSSSSNSSKL